MIYNLFGFAEVRILPLLLVITSFLRHFYCWAVKLAYFVEPNISYQPCKFQLSRMFGSNFKEGMEKHPHQMIYWEQNAQCF